METNIIELIKTLNVTDWIIVGVFAISIIYGGMRGLFKEMGALIIWIVAFFVAWTFYDQFSVMLAEYIPNDQIRSAASVIILILGVILVGSILNMFLSLLINKAGLGGIDKIFGLFFGFVRAGLLVGIAAHMFTVLHLSNNAFLSESVLLKKLAPYGEWVYNFIPENLRNSLEGGNASDKNDDENSGENATDADVKSTAMAKTAKSPNDSKTIFDTVEAETKTMTSEDITEDQAAANATEDPLKEGAQEVTETTTETTTQ